MNGLVRVSYQTFDIEGTEVRIYECGSPPVDEYGYPNADSLFTRTFLTDNSNKDVFYEAYRDGSSKPFHTSKAPPTKEELAFQLNKSQQDQGSQIAVWAILAVIVLYFILR